MVDVNYDVALDVTLENIHKGTDAETLIRTGQKIRKAGIKLSVTVLLGIAGETRSLIHALKTGEILTAIQPNHVGALTLMVLDGTPLEKDLRAGRFKMPPPRRATVRTEGNASKYPFVLRPIFLKPRL